MRAENISFRTSSGPPLRALYIDENGERFFTLEIVGFAKDPEEQSVAVVLEDDGHLEKISEADGFVCVIQAEDTVAIGNLTGMVRESTSPRILYYADKAQRRLKGGK